MKSIIFLLIIGFLFFGCAGAPEGPKDCGTDLNCFIEASENCSNATMEYAITLPLMGVEITSVSSFALEAGEENKCIFHMKTKEISVKYSDAIKEQLRAAGKSDEDIAAAEAEATENAQKSAYDDKCVFEKEELTAMLKRWQNGSFSSSDYENATCSGKIYGEEEEEEIYCTKNSDCGEGGLCNLRNNKCLTTGPQEEPEEIAEPEEETPEPQPPEEQPAEPQQPSEPVQETGEVYCTKNSDCGEGGLCNLRNNKCLTTGPKEPTEQPAEETELMECESSYDCELDELCSGLNHTCFKNMGKQETGEDLTGYPYNYQYSDDPYAELDARGCKLIEGTPDMIAIAGTRQITRDRHYKRFFVRGWYSYCMDDDRVRAVQCTPNDTGQASDVECPEGTSCRNGQCADPSTAVICEDQYGDGGLVKICSGSRYHHSSGIVIKPTVKLTDDGWEGTIQVTNHGIKTEYEPSFKAGEMIKYFTTPDKSETISIIVLGYGDYENNQKAMVMEIEPRWGLDPALLE